MDQDPLTTGTTGAETSSPEQDQTTQTTIIETVTAETTPTAKPRKRKTPRKTARSATPAVKKKHGVAIIVSIIIALILVGLVGFVIWLAVYRSQPRQIVLDAVEHFLAADHVSAEGEISLTDLKSIDGASAGLTMASIELKTASDVALPNSTEAWLKFTLDGNNMKIKLGTVQLASGVAYVQVSGLMDAIDQLKLDRNQWEEMSNLFDLLEIVDNEWWEISVPNIIDSLELEQAATQGLKGVYNCAIDALHRDDSAELIKLYHEHQFVQVSEATNNALGYDAEAGRRFYRIGLDRDSLASFVNALPESEAADEFFACYNKAVDQFDGQALSAQDIDEISAGDLELPNNLEVYLEIADVDRQITRILANYQDEEQLFAGHLSFKYDAIQVTTPANYRPVTDLVDEIIELYFTISEPDDSEEGNGTI